MSKSEGNIFQLKAALDEYGREAVVAYLISGHYRQPIGVRGVADGGSGRPGREASEFLQDGARARFRGSLGGTTAGRFRRVSPESGGEPERRLEAFREALADDFNTPRAMAEVFELVAEANRDEVPGAVEAVAEMLELVGLGTLAGAG